MNKEDFERVINDYIVRARYLRMKLYFAPRVMGGKEDAERYMRESAEYSFILELLTALSVLNWTQKDYKFEIYADK